MYNQIDKKLEARIVKNLESEYQKLDNKRLADLEAAEFNIMQDLADTIKDDFEKEKKSGQSFIDWLQSKPSEYFQRIKLGSGGKVIQFSDYFKSNYGIVFSQTKDYADMVKNNIGDTCVSHHSVITAKNRLLNLKRFADGRTKVKRISSAKTLDEGVTLPRLEFAVIASGTSKPKQMIQRVGRCLRLDVEGKHAIIIRLYAKDTVEETWLSKAQKEFKIVNINSINEVNVSAESC